MENHRVYWVVLFKPFEHGQFCIEGALSRNLDDQAKASDSFLKNIPSFR